MGHGSQKLFGLFGGKGLAGTTQMMQGLGLHPAEVWAVIAALGEFVGGLLLVAGLFTPVGALLIIGTMLVAIAKVHWNKGFWNAVGGIEFPLVLLAIAVVLGLTGAGAYSLDTIFSVNLSEPLTFVIGLLALVVLLLLAIPIGAWIEEHAHVLHRVPSSS